MYNDLMSVCLRWKTLAYCELNKGSGVCATAKKVILVHVSFQVSIVDNNWDNDFIEISIQGETETII